LKAANSATILTALNGAAASRSNTQAFAHLLCALTLLHLYLTPFLSSVSEHFSRLVVLFHCAY